ncbi:MAG: galactofuranose transport system ATP-binding protein [Chthoniobacter sp.]|jgi:simple sugar transport system ATP-binding protein|nr:galactofuranose transport system ATP-binding protein [Chthoniobacter sp.]
MNASGKPLLEVRGLTKGFPGVRALDGVDFTVRSGEIHALMGENGAGKSTLIKVLTGVYERDSGDALLDGLSIHPRSPREAEECGISTVYQEVNLVPHLSVAENICLGRQPTRFGAILWGAIADRARRALARLDLKLDVSRQLSSCSIAIQQMVALARALDVSARLLILDEPTSSLDEREVAELFKVMRKLRDEGMGIVFVTHFMDQVYSVSDRITVLRNGQLVGEFPTAELPRLQLIARMIGKDIKEVEALSQHHPDAESIRESEPFLQVKNFGRKGSIAPIDLSIHAGEVVGLAGLLGSGRTEVARLIFGVDRADSGEMKIGGETVSVHSPRAAMKHRIAFTTEDRKAEGIIPNLSIRENIVLALQASRGPWRKLSRAKQDELADRFIKALAIKTPGPEQLIKNLSGGNQQKVLLGRWLATEPRLLILDEPTRGIDVGAKAEIEKLIASLRKDGLAILFISSELEEVVRDSQRVVILRDRKKVGELSGAQITEDAIMHTIAAPTAESASALS